MLEVIHAKGWTFFPWFRQVGDQEWEGCVDVLSGVKARVEHVCIRRRPDSAAAFADAALDALTLAEMV